MSDDKSTADPKPKKKGGFIKAALFGLVLLGAGGGGTYAAFASGMIGQPAEKAEDLKPKLVLKGAKDPFHYTVDGKDKDKIEIVHGAGGSKYRTAYYNFDDEFTSNLAGGAALIQISVAASTHHDGRVLMWMHEHETALRSRILVELASTEEAELMGVSGKEQLQVRLAAAINEVLEEREGFGGVANVYFRSLIIQ
ncbi:flagellar basal body-associated protein FliL [Erythrobacter sp. QSSC1-22B]|uniref:flagellar basal body-associated FliL family protein n=1 Tax=Erythrobacter sp. QSSC1-22B TaxID=1860125 RepID=UPI000805AAEB|nr:flagellar basal body-associated FliL family protein [Erythrobacter sp. QSSC1-22B]OBX18839.1 flagellar basal body-associated protein FliL [Erythrobacter sp. QSSC1-22B]